MGLSSMSFRSATAILTRRHAFTVARSQIYKAETILPSYTVIVDFLRPKYQFLLSVGMTASSSSLTVSSKLIYSVSMTDAKEATSPRSYERRWLGCIEGNYFLIASKLEARHSPVRD